MPSFVLDFGSDILSGVTGLDLTGGGLARQGLHKGLHVCICVCHEAAATKLLRHLIDEEERGSFFLCLVPLSLLRAERGL